jgi:hypothetical protein
MLFIQCALQGLNQRLNLKKKKENMNKSNTTAQDTESYTEIKERTDHLKEK